VRNRYQELLVALSDAGADFVVAGGVAAVLQGVERSTLDIDLSVGFSPKSLDGFLGVMERFQLTPRVPISPDVLRDPDAVRSMVEHKNAIVFTFDDLRDPLWHVDVFLRDELAYERLVVDSECVDVNGRRVRVLTKRKLLELKQAIEPPRAKDQMDIAELKRLLGQE
jgi:hypothetical protein